eukprot:g143.t1
MVEVFFRFHKDKQGYFPVESMVQGILHPCVAKTDGWIPAVVEASFTPEQAFPELGAKPPKSGSQQGGKGGREMVKIRYLAPFWYNRQGQVYNDGQKRRESVGSNPSDNFINTLFGDFPYQNFGTDYEIWSAFIQSTHELRDIHAPLIRQQMQGEMLAGCYFLWPIGFQDGHEFCGYVNSSDLFQCMRLMEAQGIVSRFPHHSHFYQLLASKVWTASWGLIPGLNTPLTTKLSRSLIIGQGYRAAAQVAIQALQDLNKARSIMFPAELDYQKKEHVLKGVAKLGYSWESMDVNHWTDVDSLATGIEELVQQPGNLSEFVHVQEWVDIDVEMRHFVVLPNDHGKIKVEKIVYTCYENKADNHFSSFNRFDRATCLEKKFHNDEKALAEAERLAHGLITRLYYALRGECAEMPPALRFDVLAHRSGPGSARVMIGEITELGACFLGWPEGPQVVFRGLLQSAGNSNAANVRGTWGPILARKSTGPGPPGAGLLAGGRGASNPIPNGAGGAKRNSLLKNCVSAGGPSANEPAEDGHDAKHARTNGRAANWTNGDANGH